MALVLALLTALLFVGSILAHELAHAALNVIPGFPLDGGGLLLSLVWRIAGSSIRAIRVAARVGQGMALLIVFGGLAAVVARGEPFGLGLWPVLVGAMLYQGASA